MEGVPTGKHTSEQDQFQISFDEQITHKIRIGDWNVFIGNTRPV